MKSRKKSGGADNKTPPRYLPGVRCGTSSGGAALDDVLLYLPVL